MYLHVVSWKTTMSNCTEKIAYLNGIAPIPIISPLFYHRLGHAINIILECVFNICGHILECFRKVTNWNICPILST